MRLDAWHVLHAYVRACVDRWLDMMGISTCRLRSDNEPSVVQLAQRSLKRRCARGPIRAS